MEAWAEELLAGRLGEQLMLFDGLLPSSGATSLDPNLHELQGAPWPGMQQALPRGSQQVVLARGLHATGLTSPGPSSLPSMMLPPQNRTDSTLLASAHLGQQPMPPMYGMQPQQQMMQFRPAPNTVQYLDHAALHNMHMGVMQSASGMGRIDLSAIQAQLRSQQMAGTSSYLPTPMTAAAPASAPLPVTRAPEQPGKRNLRGLEPKIERTVHVRKIHPLVTEAQLAEFFQDCGPVTDCRICGDANNVLRFGFVEFADVPSAARAVDKSGLYLAGSQLHVNFSKTPILPVSRELMPQSEEEFERCSRTVYVNNIDKSMGRADVTAFFEQLCGPVSRLRLLGESSQPTRIAFVEFVAADSAVLALNCSGALLGSLPVRISPSKTPVRSAGSSKARAAAATAASTALGGVKRGGPVSEPTSLLVGQAGVGLHVGHGQGPSGQASKVGGGPPTDPVAAAAAAAAVTRATIDLAAASNRPSARHSIRAGGGSAPTSDATTSQAPTSSSTLLPGTGPGSAASVALSSAPSSSAGMLHTLSLSTAAAQYEGQDQEPRASSK